MLSACSSCRLRPSSAERTVGSTRQAFASILSPARIDISAANLRLTLNIDIDIHVSRCVSEMGPISGWVSDHARHLQDNALINAPLSFLCKHTKVCAVISMALVPVRRD